MSLRGEDSVSQNSDFSCKDASRPLAGQGLPPGPWLDWSCLDLANFYGPYVKGNCDPDLIRGSPHCDASCQKDPGFIQRRCPLMCGICHADCSDVKVPLANLGLPEGPWLHWTCEQYAGIYGAAGQCDDKKIKASKNCDQACQQHPPSDLLRIRCPATCGVCPGGHILSVLAFLSGFTVCFCFAWCMAVQSSDSEAFKKLARSLCGIVFLVLSFLFWDCWVPRAKAYDIDLRPPGLAGDGAGFAFGLVSFLLLPGLLKACCLLCGARGVREDSARANPPVAPPTPTPTPSQALLQQLEPSAPTIEQESNGVTNEKLATSAPDLALCVVCLDNPRSVLIRPCLHFCLCSMCAFGEDVSWKDCPVCRGPVGQLESVYI